MLLLFPYFLCCPPSPPCRAALHAGACWPWRPTRYCQPTFHAPFCGLEIFLRKGASCMSDDLSPLSLPLPPVHSIVFPLFYWRHYRDNRHNRDSKIPFGYWIRSTERLTDRFSIVFENKETAVLNRTCEMFLFLRIKFLFWCKILMRR